MMDLDFSSLLILLSFLVFLTLLCRATSLSKPKSSNLPPGPRKLPFIGNLHLLASSLPPHRVLANLALKYGPLMHLQLGEVSTVVVSSPEAAKEIMKTHDVTFANRPNLLATEILAYKSTDIAFAPYGGYWRQLRRICTLELLSTRRVQSFRTLRETDFLNMCRRIASKQGSTIDLTETVELTMCDTFMQASIGKTTGEQGTLLTAIKESIDLASGFFVADVFPSIKVLELVSGMKGKLEEVQKTIDRIFDDIINARKVAAGGDRKQREDLLDVLLKFNEDVGHEVYLTSDNVKAVIMDMFGAGIATSSSIVDWAMAEMLRHPEVLQKAQDEVRQAFNDMGFVDESRLDQLKYLKLVVKETLRVHGPSPLLLPRENHETCEINGYKLPAKTRVIVNAWAIAQDPRIWRDPDSFIPERYLDTPVDFLGNNFDYIPFGAGRRICPGMTFALAVVELPLAMLLYHFDWVLSENVDMSERFGATVRRENPIHVIPVVKNSPPAP